MWYCSFTCKNAHKKCKTYTNAHKNAHKLYKNAAKSAHQRMKNTRK